VNKESFKACLFLDPNLGHNPWVWNPWYNVTTLLKNVGPSQDGLVGFCTGVMKLIIQQTKKHVY